MAPAMRANDFLSGISVAVDPAQIERQLARFWKPAERKTADPKEEPDRAPAREDVAGTVTRACLSNIIVFLPDASSCTEAGAVLPEIARSHPARMILLAPASVQDSGGRREQVEACVTAVCHRPAPGMVPVCCEQITLLAPAGRLDLLPGIVLALLVPDLPVSLLWTFTGEGESDAGQETLHAALRSAVGQVVFDSRRREAAALRRVQEDLRRRRYSVEDLAWWDTLPWREILAEIFDEAPMQPLLGDLQAVKVTYAGEGSTSRGAAPALLLAGWLASRLGWEQLKNRKATKSETRALLERRLGTSPPLAVSVRSERRDGARRGTLLSLRLQANGDGGFVEVELTPPGVLAVRGSTRQGCVLPRSRPVDFGNDAQRVGQVLENRRYGSNPFGEALDVACELVE